ncbi:uncharacterized protein LOC111292365 isoform X2 [Durio zibethinus]|uniref:Conserved oligomeric Golgi complex subunit 7 n=1 Tax=Durio zibethinus TaxID=66656 RepID=A0A6P5YIX3_DURZI|nr:uncharacterized protein LOC111292365 isoform X2 [Durio zibethinus]
MKKFDPEKLINWACKTRHPQDSLDKHMVDLEMKLQMVSEEIAASLEEQSAAALRRVLRAIRDILRLREDAVLSAIFSPASSKSSRSLGSNKEK